MFATCSAAYIELSSPDESYFLHACSFRAGARNRYVRLKVWRWRRNSEVESNKKRKAGLRGIAWPCRLKEIYKDCKIYGSPRGCPTFRLRVHHRSSRFFYSYVSKVKQKRRSIRSFNLGCNFVTPAAKKYNLSHSSLIQLKFASSFPFLWTPKNGN